jgi:urocanate hydratase
MQQELLSGSDLQRQTLRLYGELVARHESWAGKLVFACGEGASATGLPAAASIAGGTALLLDPDAAAVKAVFRQGGVDFVVNTLDEALRVLKNEIRKQRPLSVALKGDVQSAVIAGGDG